MLLEEIRAYRVILASASPRRKELLRSLGISFEHAPAFTTDESYSADLPAEEVPVYLARKKSLAYPGKLEEKDILITADTIVAQGNDILHKPTSKQHAFDILKQLSESVHTVFTGVSLRSSSKSAEFISATEVTFGSITDEEIDYYIETYRPYDKAGAYGIQEWIGFVAVERISGSYFNVMGLPIHKLYRELEYFIT
ncbi:Maf family nucleotide pyrophosphatase [Bacteroidota bacterium]